MPMRRRTSTGSTPSPYRFWSWYSILPSTRAPAGLALRASAMRVSCRSSSSRTWVRPSVIGSPPDCVAVSQEDRHRVHRQQQGEQHDAGRRGGLGEGRLGSAGPVEDQQRQGRDRVADVVGEGEDDDRQADDQQWRSLADGPRQGEDGARQGGGQGGGQDLTADGLPPGGAEGEGAQPDRLGD